MKAYVSGIRLHVNAGGRKFGASVDPGPGLNIIRGANSRGKTQFAQAIIFALGMERMLTARANAPLGSAFTSELSSVGPDGTERSLRVSSSWVAVELTTETGDVVCVQRFVKHPRFARNLVRVWRVPILSQQLTSAPRSEDMFLHESGSATGQLGFHRALAQFLNWDLPRVATFAGQDSLLYPDAIFPFLIVDQQSWGSAGPRKVERFQIREPTRRALEFLLQLDGPASLRERDRLERQLVELRAKWAGGRSAATSTAAAAGASLANVVETPIGLADRDVREPTSLAEARLDVLHAEEWVPIETALDRVTAELAGVASPAHIHSESTGDAETRAQISALDRQLAELGAALSVVESEASLGEAQVAALERRVAALQEERTRNADIRTLSRLGGEVEAAHLAGHNCPTCRQSLDAVEAVDADRSLDLEGTIQLLNAQVATSSRMLDRTKRSVAETVSASAALQRQADLLRSQKRALEADLSEPEVTPSRGEIARQVALELRRDELTRVSESVAEALADLQETANAIAATRMSLRALPSGMSARDRQVLDELEGVMQENLLASGFGSYDPRELKLDEQALRPSRVGFDLDTDASASDVVRTKIAYLEAVRRLGASQGVHPGLLVLDEPRQQDMQERDFGSIMAYLGGDASSDGGQVVLTVASDADNVRRLLAERATDARLFDFGEGRVLQPVPDDDILNEE